MTQPTSPGSPRGQLAWRAAAALYAAVRTPVEVARARRADRLHTRLRGLYEAVAARHESRGEHAAARHTRLRLEQHEQAWAAWDGGVR